MLKQTLTSPKNVKAKTEKKVKNCAYLLFILSFFSGLYPASAQPIVPAADGTDTVVNSEENRFNITGGQLSKDRANLFHSFTSFGLDAGQIANFLSNPAIRNILGRVNGGEASYINGLISVTGGQSNLFLMNPAGMIFGPNSGLNVPASFLATAANGIGFGDSWFQAAGVNDYASLVGTPNTFAFSSAQPQAIVNFGNLAVSEGHNLTFLGGSFISTGTLSAPGGQITVAAVPGESLVRISQSGMLLSLEVEAGIRELGEGKSQEAAFYAVSLAEFLTGGGIGHASEIQVNNDGTLRLFGSGIRVENGDVAIVENASVNAGNIWVIANNNLRLVESRLRATGNLNLVAGNTVSVRDSLRNPFGAAAGGNLYVQGNESIDILALNHRGMPFQSGGNMTFVTDGIFSGDSRFASGRNFSIRNLSGGAGNFISVFDPIISSEGDVIFGDYTGVALKVEAQGSITGGNITITGPDTDISEPDPDVDILNNSAALILRSDLINLVNSPNVPGETIQEQTIFSLTDTPITNGITVNNVSTAGGPVILSGAGAITIGSINTQGGEINITSSNSTIAAADILDASNERGNGGEIALNAAGNILISGIDARSNATSQTLAESAIGGNITITSNGGEIDTTAGILDASSQTGTGGAISLSAAGNLITNSIITNGGNISLTSNSSSINTAAGILETSSQTGAGGAIALEAAENIVTNNINSRSESSAGESGGNITMTSTGSSIDVRGVLATSSQTGTGGAMPTAGGAIALNAQGTLSTGNLSSSGVGGGNLTLSAGGSLTAGNLDTSAGEGNGGNVAIGSPADIRVGFINAQGGSTGIGGQVSIATPNFLRSVATFTDRNGLSASISSAGGAGGGAVTINHGGGCTGESNCLPRARFSVGAGTINGTAGAIATGSDNAIVPVQSFAGSYTQGNIQLITATPAQPPQPLPPTVEPEIPPPDDPNSIVSLRDGNQLNRDIQGNPIELYEGINGSFLDNLKSGLERLEEEGILSASILRLEIANALDRGLVREAVLKLEELRQQEFQQYFGEDFSATFGADNSMANLTNKLSDVAKQTGTQPAIVYLFSRPEQLEVVLLTPSGQIIHETLPDANQKRLLETANQFRTEITNPLKQKTTSYLPLSQQLYQWLIAPLEPALKEQGIDTLLFSMDPGLRSVPVAALHDGRAFLIEKYRLSLIPSLNLTDTRFRSLETARVLAMGASKFESLIPLPGVPVELTTITNKLRPGESFLNAAFTLQNLQSKRTEEAFEIVHLATHSEFKPGAPSESFIQLWDTQLTLEKLQQLKLNNPQVNLLVLSACRTALGDEQAELGFAGLAVHSGVKSALASLWYVSDLGTLGLMLEFYRQLNTVPLKAEALRQAQIAMLKGQLRFERGQLSVPGLAESVPLPAELAQLNDSNFSHPYYWAAFTMIGSPW